MNNELKYSKLINNNNIFIVLVYISVVISN